MNKYFHVRNISDLITVTEIFYEKGFIGYNQEKEIKKILNKLKKYNVNLEWDIYIDNKYAAIGDMIDYIESLIDFVEEDSEKIYKIIEILVGKKY